MSDKDSRHTVVRSYALVFRLERKLFKIDRWRVPLPGGVEVRALVYAGVILIALVMASRFPALGPALGLLPAPLHWGLLPGGLTFILLKLQIEGRAPHRVLTSIISWYFGERLIAGQQKADRPSCGAPIDTIWITPDWHSPRYRRAVIHGPTVVVCRYPFKAKIACNRQGEEVGDMHVVEPDYAHVARRKNTLQIPPGRRLVLDV